MSDTQPMIEKLVARIHALATATGKSPTTISASVLGSGAALATLEARRSMTFAKYDRVMAQLDEIEAAADRSEAA